MTSRLSPQARIVLNHLKNVGSITNVEANAVHRIRSLSRRITELQATDSYRIEKEFKKDFTGQRYVRYSLHPEDRKCTCSICEANKVAA
ncbi:helix-turn-helix domain-containing protein [Variovorax paradoxus]|uniref:helix-turn-helix domain-containing protein n=1 Tax=Variovorax paradoxus TaxID=34073 RepID=UPI00285E4E7F|nr:helix-turn-helix domain-containing protein [Variovorax paradoxus]MDR6455519.1 hypothetical protein [Variovorax paradoxus]